MRPLAARFVVFACALIALATGAAIGGGYLWLGYGALTLATLGAIIATAYLPHDRVIFGAIFAALTFGGISEYKPVSAGITARHVAAFIMATLVLRAFVVWGGRVTRVSRSL